MKPAAQSGVSVLQRNRLVPLIPGPAPTRTAQPWQHLVLEHRQVGAIEIPEHAHHDLCLHLQLDGTPEMEWWSEGQNRVEQTRPGALILLDAGTRDRLRFSDRSERIVLSLKPALLEGLTGHTPSFRNQWSLQDPALANLLRELDREARTTFALGKLYADLLETQLATLLLQRHAAIPLKPATPRGLPTPALRRTLEFVTDNLHRDLRLEEIAREANLSPFHFAREFKAATHQTPYQYLLDQRISRAKTLITSGAFLLEEIAAQTGFSSATNFTRAFRQRVGVPPATWRLNAT